MCKKATRSSLAMEAERRCLENPVRCKQANEAVGEELQRQTVMLISAIKDVLDAVSKNKGRRCLVRRKTDLETALESYERANVSLQQVADPDACEAATKVRRVLVDSSDDALDQIEMLIEEKVGATEVRLQGDMLVEFGIKEVEEPRIDKLVVEESANKVELEFFAAEVEVVETSAAKDGTQMVDNKSPGTDQAVKSVEEKQVDVEDVLGFCAAEDDSEFGAIKDEIEYCAAKDAEFELQRFEYEPRRFVTAGCRGQSTNLSLIHI